jgi:hypothetical protein
MQSPFRTLLLSFAILMAPCPALAQSTPRDAFVAVTPATVPLTDTKLSARYGTNIALVRFNADVLRTASVGTPVMLNLTPTLRLSGMTHEVRELDQGRQLWRGELDGTGNLPKGSSTIVINGNNATGTIISPQGEHYRIRPVGDGVNEVIKIDHSKFPTDEPEGSKPPRFGARNSNAADAPPTSADDPSADSTPIIDVLVAYTSSAATASGDIDSLIDLAMSETNTSLSNSGINTRLRLVDKMALSYTEVGKGYNTILSDFVSNSSVSSRRNAVGADISVLIINQSHNCGMANDIGATAETAFALVHHDCATGYYSFAHEIGHLMGARHDTDHDDSTTPFPYGHGYLQKKSSDGWRTIMSYPCSGGTCPTRVQHWSNPLVKYNGETSGSATSEDNARVWNERTATVASFRNPPTPVWSGAVWRYTGTPCSGNSCTGWQRLDNNPRTITVTAGDSLYQLHNDGAIWRHTGTPCNGNSCTGWQRLDNNSKSVAIAAAGNALYQLHRDGAIWRYTGTPCSGNSCTGWQRLDNNPMSVVIAAAGNALYQLHRDGAIWRYTGTPCNGNSCTGWQRLDNNPMGVAIAAANNALYQLHRDGAIWRYTGTPCSGNSCTGWQRLDNNPMSVAITAAGDALYQLHRDGATWHYTGTPCSGNSCPGWQRLDNNPHTRTIVAAGNALFQLHASQVAQRHEDGHIWQSTGTVCVGDSCPGWHMLDNNGATVAIAAGGNQLYQLHRDGRIWRSTRAPCQNNSCSGWQMLDNNETTIAIAAGGNQLYQLHRDGRIWRSTGAPCQGNSCPGWQMLDNNPRTRQLSGGLN